MAVEARENVEQKPSAYHHRLSFPAISFLALNNTIIPSDDSVLTVRFGWTRSNDECWAEGPRYLTARLLGTFPGPHRPHPFLPEDRRYRLRKCRRDPRELGEVSGSMSKFIGSNTLKFGGMYRRLGERASNPDEPALPGRSSTTPCSVAALASSGARCVPAAMGRRNSPEILDRKGGGVLKSSYGANFI